MREVLKRRIFVWTKTNFRNLFDVFLDVVALLLFRRISGEEEEEEKEKQRKGFAGACGPEPKKHSQAFSEAIQRAWARQYAAGP